MSFIETPVFPAQVGMGALVRVKSSVETTQLQNGFELTNLNWSQGLRTFTIGTPFTNVAGLEALRAHYFATGYGAHQFRFQDWTDYTVLQADGLLGLTGLGTGVPTYKLYKKYVAGTLSEVRRIAKPKSGTITGYRNAGALTVGASAGQISIDAVAGQITFVADATGTISSHAVGANHVFTLNTTGHGFTVGMKIYITNTTGTGTTVLNSIAHSITNVVGAVITTSTSTVGKTASGGNWSRYPQAADVLAFAGEFDVPAKYGSEIGYRTEARNTHVAEEIVIQEVRLA